MSYAAQITGSSTAGARGSSAAQQADSDDEDFIYGRLEVHSDDEDAGPHNKQPRQPRFKGSTGAAAAADELDPGDEQQQQLPDDFDYNGEVPDHDHSQKRQELLIYAIPLTRGKVIFLPVCPWRTEPEQAKGWKKAVVGHVGRVQGEASELWEKFATAEQGTVANKVYRLGKRVLDSISPEERLMRGVPKDISKVIIHHPSQVSPESIMEQMHTMTKSYGLAAVGRAAAATVMLPLAVGVDLVILPGPQVLTYYTMWQLYRNTDGALGTTRMTKFITQGGSSENIRVNYVIDPRLDRYYDSALDCPEGVLPADDIDALVADLREPSLQEALHSLRTKALRDSNRRTSRGGDEYVSLPPADPAAAPSGFGGGSGGGSSSLI
ncbi:hypothetical protein OEZ85_005572 [Tetradesmus obliquus]|uniref:Uncharacterized protein n=1 Tax=Tetradesmus obliquus TaxID=3088 RepID=A0ABY8UHJ4_TETOB|nr:hypothetical protein OEZ85_005572 [Tetradesmus obliquus]